MAERTLEQKRALADKIQRVQALQDADPGMPKDGPLDTAGDLFMRGIDYGPGATRTALGALTGQVTKEDLLNTLKGKAPSLRAYADRLGLPNGPSVSDIPGANNYKWTSKGGPLDISTKGALTTGADMLASPATVAGGIRSVVAANAPKLTAQALREAGADAARTASSQQAGGLLSKIARLTGKSTQSVLMGTPLSDATESVGSKIYSSAPAVQAAETAATKVGKTPGAVSQQLLDLGITGSPATMSAKAEQALGDIGDRIGSVEDQARGQKIMVMPGHAFTEGKQAAHELSQSRDPDLARMGDAQFQRLDNIESEHPDWTTDDSIRYKREQQAMAKKMGQYNATPRDNIKGQLKAADAGGHAKIIEDTLDFHNPGLGGDLHQANQEYGTLVSGIPGMDKVADSKGLRIGPAEVGSMLGLGGATYAYSHNPELTALAAILTHMVGTNTGRTMIGNTVNKIGRTHLLDPAMRETLRHNPWATGQGDNTKEDVYQ